MKTWLATLLLILFSLPALADERILSYHSDIEVFIDGSMQVTETIDVRAEGDQIKRGIYRDFPTDYRDRFGNRVRVDFTVVSVVRDGVSEPYRTEAIKGGVRLYAGQANIYLPPAVYRYALTYRTNRQLGFFDNHEELYWNVTGNNWAFPIDQASATVTLPEVFTADELAGAEAYTGYKGEQGRDYTVSIDNSGRVNFVVTRPLNTNEGLTIVVTWPKGFVSEPSANEKIDYLLRDNSSWIAAMIGLLVLTGYYVLTWYWLGRDPEEGVVFPHYEPPAGFSPASVRFITRMGYDHRTFVAAVVNLAVKQLINIFDDGDTYTLQRTNQVPDDLAAGEKVLLNQLFAETATTLELKQGNHRRIAKALKTHEASLQRNFEKLYFVTNKGWMIPGLIISVLCYCAVLIQLKGGEQIGLGFGLSAWLAGWTVGVVILSGKVWTAWRAVRSLSDAFPALFITAFAAPFLAAEIFVIGLLGYELTPAIPAVLVITVAVNALFYQLLKAPTLAGRRLLDRIEGFRLYLDVAEKDEMDFRTPPEKTPELFERFLPYALALDVEQQWTEKFADRLSKIGESGQTYAPGWYHGRAWNSRRAVAFTSALGGALGSAVASSSTAPGSSSGSGGGGSSGGGGGGGGGGGW